MSKFKVGDKVRFCSKLSKDNRNFSNGDIFTIEDVVVNVSYLANKNQAYGVVDKDYVVFENELTLLSTSELHITTDGKTTHAVLKENGKVTKRAKADCSPDDNFDFKIGARLAFDRLFGEDEPKQIPSEFWERFKNEKIAVNCQTKDESKLFLWAVNEEKLENKIPSTTWEVYKKETAYSFNFSGWGKMYHAPSLWYRGRGYTVITYTDLINGKLPKEDFEPYIAYDFNNEKIAPLGNATNLKDLAHTRLYTGDTVDLYNDSGYLGEFVICGDDFVMSVKDKRFPQGRNGVFTIIKKRSYTEIADREVVGSVKYIKSEGKNEKQIPRNLFQNQASRGG